MTDLTWTKSTHSGGNGECVEAAPLPDGGMAMRDSKDPTTVLWFTRAEWDAFVAGAKDGEFDA